MKRQTGVMGGRVVTCLIDFHPRLPEVRGSNPDWEKYRKIAQRRSTVDR